jgi:hypothetical protein
MMDPRYPRPIAGTSGSTGSIGASGDAGEHLDDLVAMTLADGEALPGAAAHAAGCAFCAGRVAAFRVEAATLSRLVALDADELAFLEAAQLPTRMVAWAAAPPFARPFAQRWETPGLLLATLVVAAAGALGWQTATSLLASVMETARAAGASAVIANLVAGWAVALIQLLWQGVIAIGDLPAIDTPALPLLALAAIMWLTLGLAPRLTPARASAV